MKGNYNKIKQTPNYTTSQVSKAGRKLRKGAQGDERNLAISIIQDFRASHSYPLMLIKNHIWRTSLKISKKVIIARRLKRLPTILNKLERPTLDGTTSNSTDVSRMQDIGGCRAIFRDKKDVYALVKKLQRSRSVHGIARITDYNSSPKESGYRGIHVIYDCYSKNPYDIPWKGRKIEVQIRTKIQHAWATAVEMVDLFEDTDLKTSMSGHLDWRSFFKNLAYILSITELSSDEKSALNESDKSKVDESLRHIRHLNQKLNILQKFISYSMTCDSLGDLSKKDGTYLVSIELQEKKFQLTIEWYSDDKKEFAIQKYNRYELDPSIYQTVLVSAQGAGSLKQAYPNLFADTNMIARLLTRIVDDTTIAIPTSRGQIERIGND